MTVDIPRAEARRTRRRRRTRAAVAACVAAGLGVAAVAAGSSYAASRNLVVNPGFEDGLRGWFAAAPFTLTRTAGGRSGDHGAQLTNAGTRTRTGALNDTVNTVRGTAAGHTYRARAYVRSNTAGRQVSIRLMEYRGTTFLGAREGAVTLPDTRWHRVSVDRTAATDGATLDLNVVATLPASASVEVDDLRLVDLGATAAAPPGTSTTSPGPAGRTTPSAGVTSSTVGSGAATSAPPGPTTAPPSATTSTGATSTTTSTAPSAPRTTTPAPPPPPGSTSAVPAGWRLVWSDEFSGGVDVTRWTVDDRSTFGDGNSELACLMNRPENIFTSGGALTLRARRESTPVVCGSRDSRFPGGRSYTSALLRTKASWTYGRFEIRARLPVAPGGSKGLWPAFWLRPQAGGTGELDVLEAIGSGPGGDTSRRIHQTIWYDYVGTHPRQVHVATTPFDASAGWHTYAAEWEPGEIRWYVDGVLTSTRTRSTTPWIDTAFGKPFFVRLNLAVGGSWPGSPDSSTRFPADYSIDYLRVYQR